MAQISASGVKASYQILIWRVQGLILCQIWLQILLFIV